MNGNVLNPKTEFDPTEGFTQTAAASPTESTGLAQTQPAAEQTIPWVPGELVFREFVVERELGRGGMGVVYAVRSAHDGTQYAVKRALVHTPRARTAVMHELQMWAEVREHPNVVNLRFLRTEGNELGIFAEYVRGSSLHGWIYQHPEADDFTRCDIAIQFAMGLHVAHESGLVHQDVKPANALLSEDGTVLVTDFGLSRLRQAGMDDPSRGLTIAYCSPEQAGMQTLGVATDVWSWGASVLELFLGTLCWEYGTLVGEVLAAPPEGTRPLPAWLLPILHKALAPLPEDRWHSLRDAANALIAAFDIHGPRKYPRTFPTVPPLKFFERKRGALLRGEDVVPSGNQWITAARQLYGDTTPAPAPAAVSLLDPRGRALARLEGYEEAETLLLALTEQGNELAHSYWFLARCHHGTLLSMAGDEMGGEEVLLHAQNNAPPFDGTADRTLILGLGWLHQSIAAHLHLRGRELIERTEHALTFLRPSADTEFHQLVARRLHANGLMLLGNYEQAAEELLQVLQELRERLEYFEDDRILLNIVVAGLARTLRELNYFAEAEALVDAALEDSKVHELAVVQSPQLMRLQSQLALDRGNFTDALVILDQALVLLEHEWNRESYTIELENVGLEIDRVVVLQLCGEFERSLRESDRLIEKLEHLVVDQSARMFGSELARLHQQRAEYFLLSGQTDRAHQHAKRALTLLETMIAPSIECSQQLFLCYRVLCSLALSEDRLDDAREWVSKALLLSLHRPSTECECQLLNAQVYIATSSRAEAHNALARAGAAAQKIALSTHRTLLELGIQRTRAELLEGAGEISQALRELQTAESILDDTSRSPVIFQTDLSITALIRLRLNRKVPMPEQATKSLALLRQFAKQTPSVVNVRRCAEGLMLMAESLIMQGAAATTVTPLFREGQQLLAPFPQSNIDQRILLTAYEAAASGLTGAETESEQGFHKARGMLHSPLLSPAARARCKAMVFVNHAVVLRKLGQSAEALRSIEDALTAMNELVFEHHQRVYGSNYVQALQIAAGMKAAQRDVQGYVQLLEKTVAVTRQLQQEGWAPGAVGFGQACASLAQVLGQQQHFQTSIALCNEGITAARRAPEARSELGTLLLLRAVGLFNLGHLPEAKSEGREALTILREQALQTGRADLRQLVQFGETVLAPHL